MRLFRSLSFAIVLSPLLKLGGPATALADPVGYPEYTTPRPGDRASEPPAPAPLPPAAIREDEAEPETLFGGHVAHGAYGGPTVAYTRMRGDDALLVGARGGWLLNHRLVLGGAGHGLASRVAVPKGATANDADYQLAFGYGGFWTEYLIAPGRMLHGSIGALIGGGGLTYARFRHEGGDADGGDAVLVLEPVVTGEINLTRFLRAGVFASYRAVTDVDLPGLAASDVRGFSAGAIMKFGLF